ncbi:GNAT family N-acetyltransferase [Paenibacillus mendelii]|uniref:GNAT family N-acetyltransferase n=1 Tax=Paenibacillus mendelii TaxID=206163 RepID=A0ABV6JB18_9BACL|nr:GNAT family N-acetyltransferase [Paenibacillus mendelii]MCQ6562990.1 GNAT family N-acetyltransferase [Paenibacillus mendelii]
MNEIEELVLKQAGSEHIRVLTEMNQELIRDEQSENRMDYGELYNRMSDFISSDWKAMLLVCKEEIIGYGLYQERKNAYDSAKEEIYLRQYFIRKPFRGRGLGREGVIKLRADVFPKSAALILDVLESNDAGRRFWESLGFKPYYTNMKLQHIKN